MEKTMANLERILSLTDSNIQFWLRTIEEQDLLNGVVGVSAEVRQRVTNNLSPRAKVAVRDYVETHSDLNQRIIDASLTRLESSLKMVR
jgi:flagellar motor switch protein FliG